MTVAARRRGVVSSKTSQSFFRTGIVSATEELFMQLFLLLHLHPLQPVLLQTALLLSSQTKYLNFVSPWPTVLHQHLHTHLVVIENHRSLIQICITPSVESTPGFFPSASPVMSRLTSSFTCQLISINYHHHSHHPSLFHSFTPGSKPTFSTNPSHLRFLLPTGLLS